MILMGGGEENSVSQVMSTNRCKMILNCPHRDSPDCDEVRHVEHQRVRCGWPGDEVEGGAEVVEGLHVAVLVGPGPRGLGQALDQDSCSREI